MNRCSIAGPATAHCTRQPPLPLRLPEAVAHCGPTETG
jgi:hypothetical protein